MVKAFMLLPISLTGHLEPTSNHCLDGERTPWKSFCGQAQNVSRKSKLIWLQCHFWRFNSRIQCHKPILGEFSYNSIPILQRQLYSNTESLRESAKKDHVSEPYNSAHLNAAVWTRPVTPTPNIPQISHRQSSKLHAMYYHLVGCKYPSNCAHKPHPIFLCKNKIWLRANAVLSQHFTLRRCKFHPSHTNNIV